MAWRDMASKLAVLVNVSLLARPATCEEMQAFSISPLGAYGAAG